MAKNYYYAEVETSKLLLDVENPRFASSALIRGNATSISQDDIILHLLRYDNVIGLAKRISSVKGLHGSELVSCCIVGNRRIVLEGNRRICACKLLLNRELVPEKYKASFPSADNETVENIKTIQVCVYPDRQSVQAYLSDRHIIGIKKWSALEKIIFI